MGTRRPQARAKIHVDQTDDQPRPLLADGDFRAVWVAGILMGIVRWLEFLAVGIFALDVTGSAFLVALLALIRFAPLALFGVFVGALSDTMDSARLLRMGVAAAGLVALGMTVLFVYDLAGYGWVAAATFLSGILWASDIPVRRRLIGEIAGMERLGPAMALDTATSNGTRLLGPLIGGLAYQWIGGTGIFLTGAVLYAVSWLILLRVRRPAPQVAPGAVGKWYMRPLRDAWEACRYAAGNRELVAILGVTIVFNIWGFPMLSMIPVIGRVELGLTASEIGMVTALEGACALISALLIARLAKPQHYRRLYYYAVWAVLAIVFLMGISPSLPALSLGLIGAGLAGAGFATMQTVLVYMVAPLEMRGRLLGLVTICIGSGLIGFANIGWLADTFGASTALWVIALEGVIPMLWCGWIWTELREKSA